MIVYRKNEEKTAPSIYLNRIRSIIERIKDLNGEDHDSALELLMEWGVLESAAADALCAGGADSLSKTSYAFRQAGILAGHVFCSSWDKRGGDAVRWAGELSNAINEIYSLNLPSEIIVREPEGYAHYGLFPEVYMEAARDFYEELRPAEAVCIGLRSIGTSLSSVIAAKLADLNCQVHSYTLRPQGHPFDRFIKLTDELRSHLGSFKSSYFLISDEGPGLSGSSFASAAKALSEAGVSDERIIFFPSWLPDGSAFLSDEARQRWQRHRKYAADFDSLWIKSGRLKDGFTSADLINISGGGWRSYFYNDEGHYPAVNPHHEKRKYISLGRTLNGNGNAQQKGRGLLFRFAGLGRWGRAKHERALKLSDAGFSQDVIGFKSGFLVTEFIHGRPLAEHEVNQLLLDTMARYTAFLNENFKAPGTISFDEVCSMIKRNTSLGLGDKWEKRLGGIEAFRGIFDENIPVAVDGRMLPNEWLLTHRGYIKADAFDHHADQFFPCCQDIAWDLAGAIVEFGLNPMEEDYLISRYHSHSREKIKYERLLFYMIAYLAYRLGYAYFAAKELARSPDGLRFNKLMDRYSLQLKRELLKLPN
ncbi:MAG: hypothetical protein HY954_08880 [Deltaproteobacteria bacterium]|nr:hypothetical protein [Deltaproteobacteria bacterium]